MEIEARRDLGHPSGGLRFVCKMRALVMLFAHNSQLEVVTFVTIVVTFRYINLSVD